MRNTFLHCCICSFFHCGIFSQTKRQRLRSKKLERRIERIMQIKCSQQKNERMRRNLKAEQYHLSSSKFLTNIYPIMFCYLQK